jgi:hypothetical protein
MARIIVALAICGTALAATSAAAQNGHTLAAPAIPLAPPPAPYDSTTGSTQSLPSTETQRAQTPAAETLPVVSPPQTRAAATPAAPPKEMPVAENKAAERPAGETGPPAGTTAEDKQPAPMRTPVIEGKAPETPPAESVPQNGATAEGKPAENAEARFTFSRMNEGYVRLDNRTGQVSFCSKRTVGWTCQLAPEDRGVLESEIARLQEENVSLKKELLARGLPLPGSMKNEPPVKSQPPVAQNERPFGLPSDADLDRMKVMVERAWRRLVDMISTLQKDVLKKS